MFQGIQGFFSTLCILPCENSTTEQKLPSTQWWITLQSVTTPISLNHNNTSIHTNTVLAYKLPDTLL